MSDAEQDCPGCPVCVGTGWTETSITATTLREEHVERLVAAGFGIPATFLHEGRVYDLKVLAHERPKPIG